jgi:hypothetical protein
VTIVVIVPFTFCFSFDPGPGLAGDAKSASDAPPSVVHLKTGLATAELRGVDVVPRTLGHSVAAALDLRRTGASTRLRRGGVQVVCISRGSGGGSKRMTA